MCVCGGGMFCFYNNIWDLLKVESETSCEINTSASTDIYKHTDNNFKMFTSKKIEMFKIQ
jgi:hypothetical protein